MKFFPSLPDKDKNELFFFTSGGGGGGGEIKPRIRILARKWPRSTVHS